jgi:hypothetical protein
VKPPGGGVTRISPYDTRPGGENSAGALPKFRKWETSEEVRLGSWKSKNGVFTERDGVLPFSSMGTSPVDLFPFLRTASKSTSGVAKGRCGLDLVCLPLEATANRTGSPQRSHHSGVARCIVAFFKF